MGDLEKMKNEALEIIGQFENLPRLVVFDLDYTLWPFYCECCCEDEIPYLYPHAKGILEALKEKVIHVAVASRSPTPDIAKTFLHKLGIHSMFVPMVSIMGVTSILVDNGINLDALRQGFSEFSQKSGSLSTSRSD
ncbi:Magnesium-dependent phosphatase-1 family protein expressed [Citrus sinensis]|nr:Magnesium-dependent phosphatase-1 family protein expressed [Citrus sinensis]